MGFFACWRLVPLAGIIFCPLVLKRVTSVLSLLEVMTSESGGVIMTDNQKALIQIYRKKGMSYKKIADALSVSINTIKTFCKRNGLGGVMTVATIPDEVMVIACRCCGKPVSQNPGRKQKRFCSDSMMQILKDNIGTALADEIDVLRDKKQELLVQRSETEGVKKRIAELVDFFQEANQKLTEYNESMVRKYIKQIKIHEDKFTVCFKAKVEIEVQR